MSDRILVTGVTGWVGGPVAQALAAQGHTVFGGARFADPAAREPLEAAGVQTISMDLSTSSFDEVPRDLDLVLHFAVAKVNRFDLAFAANAHGPANLMEHCDSARAFYHCSSTAVYQPVDHEPRKENDLLGDSHRTMPGMPTYSISKIAGEVLVQHTSQRIGKPTVIARLNVPYGDTYGWPLFHLMMMEHGMAIPVHVNAPTQYSPIHSDDIVASIPAYLDQASVGGTILNLGGEDVASIEDWCTLMGQWTGLEPRFEPTTNCLESIIPDLTRQHEVGFRCSVNWQDGFRRMVETSRPELLKD